MCKPRPATSMITVTCNACERACANRTTLHLHPRTCEISGVPRARLESLNRASALPTSTLCRCAVKTGVGSEAVTRLL